MLEKKIKALLWMVAFLIATPAFTQSSEATEEEKIDMTEVIMHHIKDAHSFHIITLPGKNEGEAKREISIPLPIILLDEGVQVFSSTKLYNGTEIEEDGHNYVVNTELGYGMYHDKIYKLNASNRLDFDDEGNVVSVQPMDFSITKNVFTLFFSGLLVFLIATSTAKSYKRGAGEPKGIAKFIEPLVLFVRDEIAISNIGEKNYRRFMPYLLTAFFFIFLNALLGLVPIFPGGSNLAGSISFALMLAVITLVLTVFSGNKHYWGHIFATPGVPKWLLPIMIPVEAIGIFTKPFALTIRLFANMTAGHIVILALIGIIFTFESVAWSGLAVPMTLFIYVLKLLVSFLQAFIFTMLSALFIGDAVAEH